MFELFRSYIATKTVLTEQELKLMESLSTSRKLKKRQFLLQEGDVSRHKCFVAKGLLRLYRLGDADVEYILRFAPENWWMSDMESFTREHPARSYIDALEDSHLILWTKDNFEDLKTQIPALATLEKDLLARSFDATQDRIYSDISFTAEQKYENFIKQFPDVSNRVPLHMIASYLGVSRETLSRIRSQAIHHSIRPVMPADCQSKGFLMA